jgi:hypothetical protein
VEVRVGSQTGPILAAANLTSTGGTALWQSQTFPLPNPGGTNRLFLVFQTVPGGANGDNLFNLNWVEFDGLGIGRP